MIKPSIYAAIAAAGIGMLASTASAQVRVRDHRVQGPRSMPAPAARHGFDRSPVITAMSPGHGNPGDRITIEGRFFTGDMKVRFGNQLITPERQNQRRIVFRIPERNGVQRWRERTPVQVSLVARRGAEVIAGTVQLAGPHIARPGFETLPEVVAELEEHKQRMNKLERIRRLAVSDNYQGLVVRIDALIARENLRHQQVMANLEVRYGRYRRG